MAGPFPRWKDPVDRSPQIKFVGSLFNRWGAHVIGRASQTAELKGVPGKPTQGKQ